MKRQSYPYHYDRIANDKMNINDELEAMIEALREEDDKHTDAYWTIGYIANDLHFAFSIVNHHIIGKSIRICRCQPGGVPDYDWIKYGGWYNHCQKIEQAFKDAKIDGQMVLFDGDFFFQVKNDIW